MPMARRPFSIVSWPRVGADLLFEQRGRVDARRQAAGAEDVDQVVDLLAAGPPSMMPGSLISGLIDGADMTWSSSRIAR